MNSKDRPAIISPAARLLPVIKESKDITLKERILAFEPHTKFERSPKERHSKLWEEVRKLE